MGGGAEETGASVPGIETVSASCPIAIPCEGWTGPLGDAGRACLRRNRACHRTCRGVLRGPGSGPDVSSDRNDNGRGEDDRSRSGPSRYRVSTGLNDLRMRWQSVIMERCGQSTRQSGGILINWICGFDMNSGRYSGTAEFGDHTGTPEPKATRCPPKPKRLAARPSRCARSKRLKSKPDQPAEGSSAAPVHANGAVRSGIGQARRPAVTREVGEGRGPMGPQTELSMRKGPEENMAACVDVDVPAGCTPG